MNLCCNFLGWLYSGPLKQARLEGLADKDATEKSDAAKEAFLAELVLDSKKGSGAGTDNSRHLHKKSKEKKKNKDHRKTKDLKVFDSNELLHHETAELISSTVACDRDHLDSATVVGGSGIDLNQHLELRRRKIELEAEERKLEDEAKQKRLAEKHKRITVAISGEKAAVGLPDVSFKHSDNDEKYLNN